MLTSHSLLFYKGSVGNWEASSDTSDGEGVRYGGNVLRWVHGGTCVILCFPSLPLHLFWSLSAPCQVFPTPLGVEYSHSEKLGGET